MGCEGAMEIDLPKEAGPTEETVEALIEYLVGPLLPLKHTDFAKETPSESKQKTVAKQVHAAVVLYNYYHLHHHNENRPLNFDQFCKLALMFKPAIFHHMKHTCQPDATSLTDPENQLSLTEKAIMDACIVSETLLTVSDNIENVIKEWQVTKVAVLLVDSKKENCFLEFNNGVWSVIEKEVYPESKKRKKVMMECDEEGEVGYQTLAFLACKEVAGIPFRELKILESHLVYSLSQAKTATRFYIVQSAKEISEDNLVPIQDVISSLHGPVVKKCLGSWVITPVVEYYYLLPYADIISKSFKRESNSVRHQVKDKSADVSTIQSPQKSTGGQTMQKKSKLDPQVVQNSNSSKEEPHESKDSKNTYQSNQLSEKENGQSKKVSVDLQKKSKLDPQAVHDSNSTKEESHESEDSKKTYQSNQLSEKENGQSKKVSVDLQKKSKFGGNPSKEESQDCKVSENGYESNRLIEKESNERIIVSNNLLKKSNFDSEITHIVRKNGNDKLESVSQVADDVIASQVTGSPVDQKVKDTESSVGSCKIEVNHLSGPDKSIDVDKLLICFQKENRNIKVQTPLKVYRHAKRSTNSKMNLKDLNKESTVSQSKDEMVPPNEDIKSQPLVKVNDINNIPEDFNSTLDAKKSELSDAALRALLNKRQKLYDQQRDIEGELALCDKKIQAIMHSGVGDCLGLKLEAVIECCNEICKQDEIQTNTIVSRSFPVSLSEARLTLRKACQELDEICLSNNWMLPAYHTSHSDGGFVVNVTVKGAKFECSGESGNYPSIHEARNSAATHVIMKLRQMANGMKTTG